MLTLLTTVGKSIDLSNLISIEIIPDKDDHYQTEESQLVIAYFPDREIILNHLGYYEDALACLVSVTDEVNDKVLLMKLMIKEADDTYCGKY